MAEVIPVDDSDDPRLSDYRDVRERDLAGRGGGFIAEGRVVVEKLIAAGRHPLRSMLVAERRVEGLRPLLDGLGPDVPVYAASQPVMDRLVGFHIHRGVLASGQRREPSADALIAGLPEQALVIGLAGIANHDNMGGLFRNAAAFGADAVLLADDCCDPLYRKAIRVSVGAALTTPYAWAGTPLMLLERLEAAGFEVLALSPSASERLSDARLAARTAVLFGAEGPGLPETLLFRTRGLRIPMSGGFDSLNVATTSGIVLHHLVVQRPENRGI